jgi:hypothetical protein
MSKVCAGLPYGQYASKPSNVESINGEYYTKGTYSKVALPTSETETSSEVPTTTIPSTTVPSSSEPTTPTSSPTDPITPVILEDD